MNTTSISFKQYAFCLFLVLFSSSSFASEIRANDARELIKSTSEEVLLQVKAHRSEMKEDPVQLYSLVNEKIAPHVDVLRMSRWILGKYWRKASKDQKEQFAGEFKKLLIKTYSTALLKFSDEKISYPEVKGKGLVKKGKVNIKSEVILPDGRQFTVQYRMHNKDQGWKVYDISVDGVSLISTYRSSFATEIRKVGLSGLLDNLESKNEGFNI